MKPTARWDPCEHAEIRYQSKTMVHMLLRVVCNLGSQRCLLGKKGVLAAFLLSWRGKEHVPCPGTIFNVVLMITWLDIVTYISQMKKLRLSEIVGSRNL